MQESKINTVTKNTNSSTSIHSNLMKIKLEVVSTSPNNFTYLLKAIYIWPKCRKYALKLEIGKKTILQVSKDTKMQIAPQVFIQTLW